MSFSNSLKNDPASQFLLSMLKELCMDGAMGMKDEGQNLPWGVRKAFTEEGMLEAGLKGL